MWRSRSHSARIGSWYVEPTFEAQALGDLGKISATLSSPSSASIACLEAGAELGTQGWMKGLLAMV